MFSVFLLNLFFPFKKPMGPSECTFQVVMELVRLPP